MEGFTGCWYGMARYMILAAHGQMGMQTGGLQVIWRLKHERKDGFDTAIRDWSHARHG